MHAQDHAVFDANGVEQDAHQATPARAVIPGGKDEAPIRFVAPDGQAGLAYRPYRLHIGGRLVLGRTDEHGFTAQLSGADRAALAGWEVE